jgi:two-component system, LuxR family, response regulator FixJ
MTDGPTVFIVDDDQDMLDAMTVMAETIGLKAETFSSAQDFLNRYHPGRPGCLVLDIRMPGMNGLTLQRTLQERDIELPIIVMSGHADIPLVVHAMKAGAVDFFEKPFLEQELLDRIQQAFELDARMRERKLKRRDSAERLATLTPREREVLTRLIDGKAGKQIAAEMGISYKTMEKFRYRVMHKMKADSIAELVLLAVKLDIISTDKGGIPDNDNRTSSPHH